MAGVAASSLANLKPWGPGNPAPRVGRPRGRPSVLEHLDGLLTGSPEKLARARNAPTMVRRLAARLIDAALEPTVVYKVAKDGHRYGERANPVPLKAMEQILDRLHGKPLQEVKVETSRSPEEVQARLAALLQREPALWELLKARLAASDVELPQLDAARKHVENEAEGPQEGGGGPSRGE